MPKIKPNAFRMVQVEDRLAIHRVFVDDTGTVTAWEPEPVRLETSSRGGAEARWRLVGETFGAANATFATAPVLLYRDGKLI